MRFSIVVPVYNTQSYLKQCLQSILAQSFQDYEVLVYNDGSTDSSGSICDSFAKTDHRICVTHLKNSGPAFIRSLGIQEAHGEYIWFIDSDDTIEDGYFLSYLDDQLLHTSPEMVFFLSVEGDVSLSDRTIQPQYLYDGLVLTSGLTLLTEYVRKHKAHYIATSPVNKLFNTAFLKTYKLLFNPSLQCHEEDEFLPKTICKANRFLFLNRVGYTVRVRQNSLSRSQKPASIVRNILAKRDILILAEQYYPIQYPNDDTTWVLKYFLGIFLFGLTHYPLLAKENKRLVKKELQQNKFLVKRSLRRSRSKFNRLVSVIWSTFGIGFTIVAYNRFNRFIRQIKKAGTCI